jgi:hypothetical protein
LSQWWTGCASYLTLMWKKHNCMEEASLLMDKTCFSWTLDLDQQFLSMVGCVSRSGLRSTRPGCFLTRDQFCRISLPGSGGSDRLTFDLSSPCSWLICKRTPIEDLITLKLSDRGFAMSYQPSPGESEEVEKPSPRIHKRLHCKGILHRTWAEAAGQSGIV